MIVLLGVIALAWYAYRTYGTAPTPPYRVIQDAATYQIRAYGPTLYAQTTIEGEINEALNKGFRRLASYIFAKERTTEKIEMTAPVLFQQAGNPHRWHMRFILPERFLTNEPPKPTSPDIKIIRAARRHVAALRLSGAPDYATWQQHDKNLNATLDNANSPCEDSWFARYDAPWVPSLFRRNEILRTIKEG